ncbi:MAG: hypothetical protein HKN26_05445, partial [Acidimicrobiales bacterium]|nr:hypothetical protein [Acidimicrobiales bacterium]
MADADAVEDAAPEQDDAAELEEAAAEPVVETEFGVPGTTSRGNNGGQKVLHPSADGLLELAGMLADAGWEFSGLYGVDYLTHPGRTDLPATVPAERFEVVITLINRTERSRLRLRVQVPADEPEVNSLSEIWPGTEASERE